MRLEETLLVYGLIGLAVGPALAWRDRRRAALWLLLGPVFWPLFLPLLLAGPARESRRPAGELEALRDEVARLGPLPPELLRLPGAIDAAERLRAGTAELGRLLGEQAGAFAADEPALSRHERTREVLAARREDLARLRTAHEEQEARYLRVVAQVREAITKAHLWRLSGASRDELAKVMARLADELALLSPGPADHGRRTR